MKSRATRPSILDQLAGNGDNDKDIGFSVPMAAVRVWLPMDLLLARSTLGVMLWMGLVLVTMPFGLLLLRRIRGNPAKQESPASELLSKFRELHSRGELSDAEYRTIKTTLAARIQAELKDNGE